MEIKEKIVRTIIQYDKMRTFNHMQEECLFEIYELNCKLENVEFKKQVDNNLENIRQTNKRFTTIINTLMEQVKS